MNSKLPFAREYQILSTITAASDASGRNSYSVEMLEMLSKLSVSDRNEMKHKETVAKIAGSTKS